MLNWLLGNVNDTFLYFEDRKFHIYFFYTFNTLTLDVYEVVPRKIFRGEKEICFGGLDSRTWVLPEDGQTVEDFTKSHLAYLLKREREAKEYNTNVLNGVNEFCAK